MSAPYLLVHHASHLSLFDSASGGNSASTGTPLKAPLKRGAVGEAQAQPLKLWWLPQMAPMLRSVAVSSNMPALTRHCNRQESGRTHQVAGIFALLLARHGSWMMGAKVTDATLSRPLWWQIGEAHPRFLRRQLAEVVAAMLQIAGAQPLEDATRQMAAEFLVTLCEVGLCSIGVMSPCGTPQACTGHTRYLMYRRCAAMACPPCNLVSAHTHV